MNKLTKWLIGKQNLAVLEQTKALPLQGTYQIIGGQFVATSDSKTSYITNGYSVNDIVYSIVNIILDKVRIAPWGVYKVVDESSLKSYTSLLRKKSLNNEDYIRLCDLRTKALEPIVNSNLSVGKLQSLLLYPNEQETFSDFITNGCGYKLLTGDKFIWAELLEAGANKGIPQSLWLLPSQQVTIKADTQSFPVKEVGYELRTIVKNYQKEEVLHEKYWNPEWGVSGTQLYGMSPLKAALKTLTRNNSAKDASASKFQNNGLEAIVYVDDPKLQGAEATAQATALKNKLIHEYSGTQNTGKIAASGYKVGVANLGLSPVELGIIESEKWDAIMLCNIFGLPPELLGLTQKTYNNVVEAEKALTTRSALPLLTSTRDGFNRKLQSDWGFKGQNVFVDFDMSIYSELQSDYKEIAEWTERLIAISPNEQRELVGLPAVDDDKMNEVWVKEDRTALSELGLNQIDQIINGQGNT